MGHMSWMPGGRTSIVPVFGYKRSRPDGAHHTVRVSIELYFTCFMWSLTFTRRALQLLGRVSFGTFRICYEGTRACVTYEQPRRDLTWLFRSGILSFPPTLLGECGYRRERLLSVTRTCEGEEVEQQQDMEYQLEERMTLTYQCRVNSLATR